MMSANVCHACSGRESRVRLRANDGAFALYSTQGEMSSIPPKDSRNSEEGASVSVPACGRRNVGRDGCGCRSWEASCKARFPPAESPPMMMLDGEMPLSSRCWTAAIVWRSCFGKGYSGARAVWNNQQEKLISHIARRRTIVQHGNPDSTLILLMNGPEHVKAINPGRNNITSA